jgi:hypothetical protein
MSDFPKLPIERCAVGWRVRAKRSARATRARSERFGPSSDIFAGGAHHLRKLPSDRGSMKPSK